MNFKSLVEDLSQYPEICSGPFYGITNGDRYVEIGSPDTKNKFPGLGVTIRTPLGQARRGGAVFSFLTKEDAQKFIDKYLDSSYKPYLQRNSLLGKKFEVGNDFCYYQLSYELEKGDPNPFITPNDKSIQGKLNKSSKSIAAKAKLQDLLIDGFTQAGFRLNENEPIKEKTLNIEEAPIWDNASIQGHVTYQISRGTTFEAALNIPLRIDQELFKLAKDINRNSSCLRTIGSFEIKRLTPKYLWQNSNIVIGIDRNTTSKDIVYELNQAKYILSNENKKELKQILEKDKELIAPIRIVMGKD